MSEPLLVESLHVDGERLRAAMRQVASPVVVITTQTEEGMRGMTASSFTSVSLHPPLISFNVTQNAQMHHALQQGNHFAIHILAANQDALSKHFSIPNVDADAQFAEIAYRMQQGVPILENTLAVFICKPFAEYPAGDHTLFLGEVIAIDDVIDGDPLLYFKRNYCTVSSTS